MKLEEMKMKELFDMSHTIAERIFDNHAYPWEVLPEIGDFIRSLGSLLPENEYRKIGKDIWIHKTAKVAPTIMMTGPMKAVNYLVKTPGGNIYHSGDSHFSIYFAKHGKDHDIDVAFGSFGENPVGMQDKMTSTDILRMAENLKCKVVVPIHWDVWTNFQADCEEIRLLYDFKKDRNEYKFHPFFWQVGGKYVYPQDKDKMYYHHRRGFEDCFEAPQNIPFRSCL